MKRMCLVVGLALCALYGARAYDKSLQAQWESLKTVSTVCSEEGTRIVETFAEEFLPNAFVRYEKARDAAKELNQVFNEDFPEPVPKDADTYDVCEKVIGRLRTAAEEYSSQKDMLAHIYFRYKAGAITSEELSKLDEEPLKIDIVNMGVIGRPPAIKELGAKQAEFAGKFLPETFAQHQFFAKEHAQSVRLYDELCAARDKISAPYDQVIFSVGQKAERIGREVDVLTATYDKLYMEHRIGDVDAESLAKTDHEKAASLKNLVQSVPMMVREDIVTPYKEICDSMVDIPGCSYKMGRTEVTQAMWQRLMGNNPSTNYKGSNLPVENVSWQDCQEFIKKLNAMSGRNFRLPTEEEWEYCCRAGGKGDWGKRANGQEGPLDAMGWYHDNSGDGHIISKLHPVAQKEPNAWGLYDMHGNVHEWTSTGDGNARRVLRGGAYMDPSSKCAAGARLSISLATRFDSIGFRLIYEDAEEVERRQMVESNNADYLQKLKKIRSEIIEAAHAAKKDVQAALMWKGAGAYKKEGGHLFRRKYMASIQVYEGKIVALGEPPSPAARKKLDDVKLLLKACLHWDTLNQMSL